MSKLRFHLRLMCKTLERVQNIAFGINRYVRILALPTLEPPFLRIAKDLSSHLGKNFKIFLNVFWIFFEISLKFQSWHARAGTAQFGLDSWLAFSRSVLGTRLRAILFSFRCTCRRPGDTRRALAEAASRF